MLCDVIWGISGIRRKRSQKRQSPKRKCRISVYLASILVINIKNSILSFAVLDYHFNITARFEIVR